MKPESYKGINMSESPAVTVTPVLGPYRHERSLSVIVTVLAVLFWVGVTLGTLGIVWIYMIFIYLFVLMTHSALISHLKGNAVHIGAGQFPELHARIDACCTRIGLTKRPEAYLMSGNGILNAFATRFLRRYYVVLLSDIVDALESDPEGINFYIGHELCHIARKHVARQWWMGPVMIFPLLGTAYRRAQEYTCDQYGAACCADMESAKRAIAVLAAGSRRWKQLDTTSFIGQMGESGGFWMSLNELTSEYPWLCKRMARVQDPDVSTPRRHFLAWLIAAGLPGAGPGGLIVSVFTLFIVFAVLASIAVPAYVQFTARMDYPAAFSYAQALASASQQYYEASEALVDSPSELPSPPLEPANIATATMDSDDGEIVLTLTDQKVIILSLSTDDAGVWSWSCYTTIPGKALPPGVECESDAEETQSSGWSMMKLLGQ
jgi:Zn-dependent protease with chaperone function/type II secretory pathway pseudopilin PulG